MQPKTVAKWFELLRGCSESLTQPYGSYNRYYASMPPLGGDSGERNLTNSFSRGGLQGPFQILARIYQTSRPFSPADGRSHCVS